MYLCIGIVTRKGLITNDVSDYTNLLIGK